MQIGNNRYRFSESLAMEWGEKILIALAILVVTWILARVAKWAFAKLVDNVKFLQRHTSSGKSVGESLGTIVSLLIWLFGILAILQVFSLGGVIQPVQTLLNSVMEFIPNLIGAAIIFFVGLIVARILRDLTVTALQTVDFDKWANRGGVDTVTGNSAISKTIGTIVFVLIIIPVSIMALEALDLDTVSRPASEMLRIFFDAIPNIIGAAIILGLGYLISRFVVQILKEILPGLGVDRAVGSMDVLPAGTTVSSIVARIVQIAIMLFAAIAATRLLGFPELTAILDQVLELGGQVIFGAVVIAFGFLIANLLGKLMAGTGENNLASAIVRYATIILFTFMGLRFMGVGEEIVDMAFGALVIGGAVAGALAFGLGGRNAASRLLERMQDKAESEAAKPASPPTPMTPKAPASPPTTAAPVPPRQPDVPPLDE
ncbi:mechanosensitive ion channel [Novosphingopyxis sp.]|uniref:mechanosensitive ion channel n=1 Tax=Novosphingopyxis sp. TaxID=2709690 RepID=UPI003B5AE39C